MSKLQGQICVNSSGYKTFEILDGEADLVLKISYYLINEHGFKTNPLIDGSIHKFTDFLQMIAPCANTEGRKNVS